MNALDPQKIARVLAAWEAGEMSRKEIGRTFHVGHETVARIVEDAWRKGLTMRDPHPPLTAAHRARLAKAARRG